MSGNQTVLFSSLKLLWEGNEFPILETMQAKVGQVLGEDVGDKILSLSQVSLKTQGPENRSFKRKSKLLPGFSLSVPLFSHPAKAFPVFVSTFLSPPFPTHFSHEVEQMLG